MLKELLVIASIFREKKLKPLITFGEVNFVEADVFNDYTIIVEIKDYAILEARIGEHYAGTEILKMETHYEHRDWVIDNAIAVAERYEYIDEFVEFDEDNPF